MGLALSASALFAQAPDKTLEIRPLVLDPVFMAERNGFDEPAYFEAWKENGSSVFSDYSSVTVQVYRTKGGMNKQMLYTSGGLLGLYVPLGTAGAPTSGAKFVLWLQDMKVRTVGDSLVQECKYLLWNDAMRAIAAYGTIRCITPAGTEAGLPSAVTAFGTQLRNSLTVQDDSPVYTVTTGKQDTRVSIRIKLNGQVNFHLPSKDADDPNIPNEYENPQTHPSVNRYFTDVFFLTPSIELVIPDKSSSFTIGVEFNNESLENSGSRTILASSSGSPYEEKLNIRTFGVIGGYSWKVNDFSQAYWFVKGRFDFRKYTGKSYFSEGNVKMSFDNEVSPGISFGVEGLPEKSRVGLSAEAGMNFGSTILSKASAGSQSENLNFKLSDNRFYLKVGTYFDWKL